MLPDAGPAGATHGIVPDTQTWPTLALPLGMPFTDQVTVVSGVFVTLAANAMRRPVATVAVGGETVTATLLAIVAAADSTVAPPVTALAVALIVTGFVAGRLAGAVYTTVSAPVALIVPTLELPLAIPLTSHETLAPAARQKEAVKDCAWPSARLADGGEIAFVAVQMIVTLALPEAEVSTVLVAVTATLAGDGTAAGAV
jgi:hypothetical protein